MNRQTARVAVIAVLSIAALGIAAATLDTARTTGGGLGPSDAGGSGFQDSEGGSPFGFDTNGSANPWAEGDSEPFNCFAFLRSTEFFALVTVFAGGAVIAVGRKHTYKLGVVLVGAFAMPGLLLWLLLTNCSGANNGRTGFGGGNASMVEGGGMPGSAAGQQPATPSLLVLAVLGVLVLVAVAAVAYSTGDDDVTPETPETAESDQQPPVERLGRVAGAAADRIDADGELENEVYRAWREMVAELAVEHPASTTPGEFAAAATSAGMAEQHVDELTELFEAVRYGGRTATAQRERDAVDALRRIEAEYANSTSRTDSHRPETDQTQGGDGDTPAIAEDGESRLEDAE